MPWIKCLSSGSSSGGRNASAAAASADHHGSASNNKTSRAASKKQLSVSQPVHLLVKNEFQPQSHVFRAKRLRRPRVCQLCHQSVIKQASCCRVCKFICHKACEEKSARFRDTSQQIHKQWQADPARAFPTVGQVVVPAPATINAANAATSSSGTTTSTGNANNNATSKKKSGASPALAKPAKTVEAASSSTPKSTPSPSPSPSPTVTTPSSSAKRAASPSTTSRAHQRTPGVGADSSSGASIIPNGGVKQQQQHVTPTPTPSVTTTPATPTNPTSLPVGSEVSDGAKTKATTKCNGAVTAGSGAASSAGSGAGGRVSEVMELCYVTERIIALWYREDARGVLEHATSLLRAKHADNYMIFNLSSPGRPGEANTREAGWPQGLAPSLERLCSLCKELDSWLNAANNRVVVLHARGSKERLGVAVSAYMNYSSICGGRDQALDRFAMRRFLDDKIGPLAVPSHRRYIEYFGGLLAGSLRISSTPLYLTHLTVLGVPLFEPTGCRAFFKVYEGLTPVFTSDLYSVTNAQEFTVNLGGLRLRGDILVKCYHRIYSSQGREVMFSLQFHTCVITENVVSFPRSELDVACSDSRCPPDSVVTLYFANDARRLDGPVPAPTPAVPHASAHHDPILHWDSYTNLELSDDEGRETPLSVPSASIPASTPRYTCGPIDGSLYAVVQQHNQSQQSQSKHQQVQQQQQHQQQQQSSVTQNGSVNNQSGQNGRGSSPLTVSMDSGISSAPPQRPSPPEDHESQVHCDLDKLLQDMMLTVESYPDPQTDEFGRNVLRNGGKMYVQDQSPRSYGNGSQPSSSSTYSTLKESCRSYGSNSTVKDASPHCQNSGSTYSTLKRNNNNNDSVDFKQADSFSPAGNIDFIDEDIPYHARQTSQPFSYGAPGEMLKQHQKLASPSLVRKASMKASDKAKYQQQLQQQQQSAAQVVDLDDLLGESNGRNVSRPMSPITPPDPPPEFANGPMSMKTSTPLNSKRNDQPGDGLLWLKQQQMKLAQRREERSPARLWRQETGNRMIGELRNVQRSRLRHDGYASDSAVLDDDDDNSSSWSHSHHAVSQTNGRSTVNSSAPASPLLPQRSRKVNGTLLGSNSFNHHHHHQSNGRPRAESFNNDRPFAGKRAYEIRKQNDNHSPPLMLQKYSNGHHQSSPPRPESRSDSFAKTESFLREHSRLMAASSLSSHSQVTYDEATSLVSSRYPSRPESRNQTSNGYYATAAAGSAVGSAYGNGASPKKDIITEVTEVLTIVDHHPASPTPTIQNNNDASGNHQSPADPLSHNDASSSWTERSVSPTSSGVQGIIHGSRPQTPAFPVHPRTPYNNASTPSVTFASDRPSQQQQQQYHHHHHHHHHHHLANNHSYNNNNNVALETNNNHHHNHNYGGTADRAIFIEERRDMRETGLPPKSPTTQRRLSYPDNGVSESFNKRWPLIKQSASVDYSKDRPVSPLDDLISQHSYGRGPSTPTHLKYGQVPKIERQIGSLSEVGAISYTSLNSPGGHTAHLQYYNSRRSSLSTEPQEVADANVKFVRDTSKIWYKPNISREQAIAMLRNAPPGTFVVRDSNSFPGAFGLALKVATPPPGAPISPKDPTNELVRHFLIEPTSRGVRLKGCANEPVFSSLSALVYQHSLMAMALPCQLLLPEPEAAARVLESSLTNSPQQLLAQGAACNVLYLFTLDTESLTGPQAIKKTITAMFDQKPRPNATIVHFKVSTQGITLTDNARKLFFRRHYPTNNISYCGLDSEERTWDFVNGATGRALSEHRCFGFVARKPAHKSDNQCHIFAELEPEQPATAIVNFVNKVLMSCAHSKANIV
ncbi:tensin-1 isoform X4 [Trichogramma pretiosum]|uniref:tensin-1 isoform X4 n=1 Tax=Trichogramma pretiosum TaxID=7493 RepID=UPI000C71C31F|nr:tensin-1 isoform X4 [Trichogramma pretiosum]